MLLVQGGALILYYMGVAIGQASLGDDCLLDAS